MKKFKTEIADDHLIFLKGLKEVLEMNEEFVVHYETVTAFSNLSELKEDGSLSVMQFSVIQNKYPDVIALPDSPVFLQKLFFKFVSAIAKLAGYKPYVEYHSDLNKGNKTK